MVSSMRPQAGNASRPANRNHAKPALTAPTEALFIMPDSKTIAIPLSLPCPEGDGACPPRVVTGTAA